MFIFLIVTSLLARAKQGKSLLPADCPCVIKVFHSKEVITGLCFLGKLIHSTWLKKYSWPEIRSLGNYTFGEKKTWAQSWECWHGAWAEGQISTGDTALD